MSSPKQDWHDSTCNISSLVKICINLNIIIKKIYIDVKYYYVTNKLLILAKFFYYLS